MSLPGAANLLCPTCFDAGERVPLLVVEKRTVPIERGDTFPDSCLFLPPARRNAWRDVKCGKCDWIGTHEFGRPQVEG